MTLELKIPRGLELKQAQADALQRWNSSLLQRLVISVPTGVGKTLMALVQVNSITGRTLWLAHRDELVMQPYEAVQERFMPDLRAGIVKANIDRFGEKLTIASVQTLAQKDRLQRILSMGRPDMIVVDEVHHVRAPTYRRILEACGAMEPRGARVMGLTATAERSDRRSLFPWMEDICYYLSLPKAIELGYLVPMIPILMPLNVDLSRVKVTTDKDGQSDLDTKQLESAMERGLAAEGVAKAVYQHALCDQTVVFSCSVPQAQKTAEELRKLGIKAEAVWGDMPEGRRREVLGALKRREIQAVANFNLLAEGWDDPGVSCVAMARPTLSQLVYVQCLDEQTEVLTKDGWKGPDDITDSDVAATFDREAGSVGWSRILSRVDRKTAPGEYFVKCKAQSSEFRVTNGHKMLYRNKHGAARWRMIEAGKLADRFSEFMIPVSGIEPSVGLSLTDDELRFIGWFLTDGTMCRKTNVVMIAQAEHQPWNRDIEACLTGCGMKWRKRVIRRSKTNFPNAHNLNHYMISRTTREESRGEGRVSGRGWSDLEPYLDKSLSPNLEAIDERQMGIFLEAIHLGDGQKQTGQSWTRRSYHICAGHNRVFSDRLQSLCIRRGYRCNISVADKKNIVLHIKKTNRSMLGGQGYTDRPTLTKTPVAAPERVWCIQTDSGTIITRRNGTVTFMGNCIGRGLRLAPGKVSCKVLDMVDASSLGLVTANSIMKTPDLDEDPSWGGSSSPEPGRDFEIELVRRFLKRARQEPVCVNGTYFVEVKPGELWVTVAKNSQPIYVKRRERGWVVDAEGQPKTDTVSQGDAMYAASVGVWEWGGPAVPTSQEWEGFANKTTRQIGQEAIS